MRSLRFVLILVLSSCVGPPAPDQELCRDLAERLCSMPPCGAATLQLNLPVDDCVNTVFVRAGCSDPAFAFTTPSRARVLDCRLPLVRESEARGAHPRCEYVDESLRNCPDLASFLRGP
ncbi:MAG: hypothetical protein JNM17_14575 [Archangium sp.]|nr:hypothetical protein [Archangium sp.]